MEMYFIGKGVICFLLTYLTLISEVNSDEFETKDANRSKRTIGLFLESLANFLNVQDIENTTPVTFTTSAPGYKRKSPPPKVQKWPPLDLEITPWVLQAVPSPVATPMPTTYPATSTIYPTTEDPGLHAQVIIIPLSEIDNNLNKNEIKKNQEPYLRSENNNPKPIKYSMAGYQSVVSNYQPGTFNHQNQQSIPQSEVYYWQRLFPNQRSAKQIHLQQPQPQLRQLYQPQPEIQQQQHRGNLAPNIHQKYNTTVIAKNHLPKQIQLLPKDAETLLRIGYLYGRSIKDELSNLGGNDFNREKIEEKYHSFIDLEPKFRYIPNATSKNDLSRMYLLERSRRLKNVNNVIKLPSIKHNYNENNNELNVTGVEIVKSVEPSYYDADIDEPPKVENKKQPETDDIGEINGNINNSPTFEMVKSFELPNSELSNGNKDFEFHLDPDEYPNHEKTAKDVILNDNETGNKNIYPFRNKKITLVTPSERERYEQRKRGNGDLRNRLIKNFTPEKLYQAVYNGNKEIGQYDENEYFSDISKQKPKHDDQKEYYNHENDDINIRLQKLNYGTATQNPSRNKYQEIFEKNKLLKKSKEKVYLADGVSPHLNSDYEIHKEQTNLESFGDSSAEKQFPEINYHQSSKQSPSRGRVKYQYNSGFNKNQQFSEISKDEPSKLLPSPQYNYNDNVYDKYNTDLNLYTHTVDPSKFNRGYNYFDVYNLDKQNKQEEYSIPTAPDVGRKPDEGDVSNTDLPVQSPDAQLHFFVPDEHSLQSPEKQEKPEESQYQNDSPEYSEKQEKPEESQYQNDSPEYYQDYVYQLPNENKGKVDEGTAEGTPRLPENLHEQLVENNGRSLVSPPSFDQQTDMTEHKVKCLPQPFVKLKYSCNNTLQYKKTNQS